MERENFFDIKLLEERVIGKATYQILLTKWTMSVFWCA